MALGPLIRGVEHDVRGDLTVRFAVGTYKFLKVPPAVGTAFVLAAAGDPDAALAFFQTKIEGKYASNRTGD